MASRRSQKVVTSDTENPAAMMRAKFESPEAEAMRSAGTPSSRMLTVAMKKEPDEIPCTISGRAIAMKLASAVRLARMKYDTAEAAKATLAIHLASKRVISLAAIGVTRTAIAPVGAETRPAQVAV